MGRLKPIGSEKLQGDDKIKRIIEIAQYGEVQKNNEYHTQTTSFTKKCADGNVYAIIQERDGYYLKSGINESELEYVNGLHNKKRDRHRSYSTALKRLNLILKPINERFNDGRGDSLYGIQEQEEKFVLKVPETEDDMGDEEIDMDMGDEEVDMDMDMEDEEVDMDMGDEEVDVDEEGEEEEMEGFMKPIQKLTGKLGQKLRDVEEELGSADIKYVLNSVIAAVDLDNLDEEDKEDILERFEDDEAAYGDEEEMDIDMGDDFEEEGEEGEELDMDFGDEGEVDVEDEEIIATESRIRRKLLSEQGSVITRILDKVNDSILDVMFGTKIRKLLRKAKKDATKLTEREMRELEQFGKDIQKDTTFRRFANEINRQIQQWKKVWEKRRIWYGKDKKDKEETNEALKNRIGNLLESYIEKKTPKTSSKYISERINKVKNLNKISKNCSSVEQEISAEKFIKENKNFNLNGKTKKGSLVFIAGNNKVLVEKDGTIR